MGSHGIQGKWRKEEFLTPRIEANMGTKFKTVPKYDHFGGSLIAQCNAGDPSLIPGSGRSPGEGIGYPLQYSCASLVTQLVKNLSAMWETWVWPLGWKMPWRRERLPTSVCWPREFHGLYSPWGRKEWDTSEWLSFSLSWQLLIASTTSTLFHTTITLTYMHKIPSQFPYLEDWVTIGHCKQIT